jgi:hypothetical protein
MGGALTVIHNPTPKTTLLRNEAANLEYGASQRESQKVSRTGYVEMGSIDHLIAHLHGDPWHVGCSSIEVLEYFERAQAKEESRLAQRHRDPALWGARFFVLSYRDGVLDEKESKVYTRPTY